MRLVNLNTLSEYLKIEQKTLYNWVSMRQIPYYKLSRLLRFDLDEIDTWMAERKKAPIERKTS